MSPTSADSFGTTFDELTRRADDHAPISLDEKAARVGRLAALLRERSIDALLVEPTATLRYLTDVEWGASERLFALVVTADAECFWVAPGFEVSRARERIDALAPAAANGPVVPWDEHEYAWGPLARELARRGVERIAIDPRARAFVVHGLAAQLGEGRVLSGGPLVRALRRRKDEHELALLRAANEMTKEAILAVSRRLRPGMTDHEIGALMHAAQRWMGLTNTWVLPLIGEGAAYPHGEPDGRTLARGDTLLIDTGGALHGYQSDITRTWVFDGAPGDEIARAWDTVRRAQVAAFEALRPGAACRDADRAARAVIEAGGYGAGYAALAHRLGHGIGVEGHEEPCLDGGEEDPLEPGMTFSNEPGIYLAGRFGLRIEDIVVVTEDGADVFGTWQRGPESPA